MNLSMTLIVLLVGFSPMTAQAQPGPGDPLDFALTLYRKTAELKPGANALVSPYSAREAVGLAYLGARGATAEGLAKALRAGPLDEFVNSEKSTRESLAKADQRTTIEIANSLWLRSDWAFLDSYEARAKDGFDAEVFRRDFSPSTVAEADDWVSRRTHGKITKAVDKLDRSEVAVLMNTVYFKGIWKHAFIKARTRPKDFHLASGTVVQRPRMAYGRGSGALEFDYAEDAELQAVRMPYGSGRLVMTVVLPAKETNLAAVNTKLTGAWWRALRSRLAPRSGEIELPTFKFGTSMRLNAPLIEMGARTAFDRSRADFRGMAAARGAKDMLHISSVQQEAVIEVDEEGTIAAARTAVTMMVAGAAMHTDAPPPFEFIADRPFLFAIEDTVTGTILFIGSVQDPR